MLRFRGDASPNDYALQRFVVSTREHLKSTESVSICVRPITIVVVIVIILIAVFDEQRPFATLIRRRLALCLIDASSAPSR